MIVSCMHHSHVAVCVCVCLTTAVELRSIIVAFRTSERKRWNILHTDRELLYLDVLLIKVIVTTHTHTQQVH